MSLQRFFKENMMRNAISGQLELFFTFFFAVILPLTDQTIMKFIGKSLPESSHSQVLVIAFNSAWDKISDKAKDLIKKMLCDASTRISAQDVLTHSWVKEKETLPQISLTHISVDNLKNYKNNNKLKKAVLTFIASRLKEDEIKSLKDIFNQFDKNHDGTLTLEEMREGIYHFRKDLQSLD